MFITRNWTVEEIFYVLFENNHRIINFKYLTNICNSLHDPSTANSFLHGPKVRAGRNRMLNRLKTFSLRNLALRNEIPHYQKLADYFNEEHYNLYEDIHISRSTVWRTLHLIGITQKNYSLINIRRKNSDGIKFLENIRHIINY